MVIPKVLTHESTLELFTLPDKSSQTDKQFCILSLLPLNCIIIMPHYCMKAYLPRNIISDVIGITPPYLIGHCSAMKQIKDYYRPTQGLFACTNTTL